MEYPDNWKIFKDIVHEIIDYPSGYNESALQIDFHGIIKEYHIRNFEKMNKREAYWLARCYLKYKKPDHLYYDIAEIVVRKFKRHK